MLPKPLLLCIVLCIACASSSFAQVKKPVPSKPKPKVVIDSVAAKRDSIWKDAVKDKKKVGGMFTLYQDTVSGSLNLYIKEDQ